MEASNLQNRAGGNPMTPEFEERLGRQMLAVAKIDMQRHKSPQGGGGHPNPTIRGIAYYRIKALLNAKWTPTTEIERKLNVTPYTVNNNLNRLTVEGFCEKRFVREGSRKWAEWRLNG